MLAINDDAVTIKEIELAIVERAFAEGWVRAAAAGRGHGPAASAVVGSGPAGLAAAQQLARAGHAVTVFERDEPPGGLLALRHPRLQAREAADRPAGRATRGRGRRRSRPASTSAPALAGDELLRPVRRRGARHRRAAPACARPCRARISPASQPGHGLPDQRRTDGSPAAAGAVRPITRRGQGRRRSSAAATPVPTAWAMRCARGRARSSRSRTAPRRRPRRTPLATWPEWPFLLRAYAAHDEGGRRRVAGRADGDRRARRGRARGARPPRRVRRVRAARDGGRPRRRRARRTCSTSTSCWSRSALRVSSDDPRLRPAWRHRHGGHGRRPARTGATGVPGVFAAGDCVRGADLIVTAIAEGRAAAAGIHARLAPRASV